MVAIVKPWKDPRTGMYYLRRAVPTELRAKLGRREWKISLGTKSPQQARQLFPAELVKCEDAFSLARGSHRLSSTQIGGLAGKWLQDQLEADRQAREHPDFAESDADGDDQNTQYDYQLWALQEAQESGDLESVIGAEVDALLRQEGLPPPDDPANRASLLKEILWAKVRLLNIQNKRHRGDWTPPNHLEEYPKFHHPASGDGRRSGASGGQGDRLSVVYKAYLAERNPAPKTVAKFTATIRQFSELHSDLPVVAIDKAMIRSFKTKLAEPSGGKQPRAGTINAHIAALSAVLTWADRNGYCESDPSWSNPCAGMKVQEPGNRPETRREYSPEHLQRIFEFPIYSEGERPRGGAGEAAVWLPLLALYTGARLEELGQLMVSDVRKEGEVSFIDINTLGEGKRVKTRSSRRVVPLHPELVRCGFLEYVEAQRKDADVHLFPELKPDRNGQRTGNWSKWWGRYARAKGLTDQRLVFHSFRHTFKSGCRAANVPKDVHDRLTGHTSGDVGDAYGSGYPVGVLAKWIGELEYSGLVLRWRYS